ncbi:MULTISPECIES: hypothetical protein [unclassified Luteimonas]
MKRLLLAVATALLVVPASAPLQATSGAVAPDMQVAGALVLRVRASLAEHFGPKRAARVAISARDGAVRVEAPELSLRDRERVEKIVREVPGVTEVIAVVGTVLRPPTAAIVGEKGRLPATGTAGVVGEKGRLPATRAAGVVGERRRLPPAGSAIVGEKGRLPTTGTAGVVGEKGRLPAMRATGIVGEKGRVSRTRVGNIDPQPAAGARVQAGTAAASPRLDDATLARMARERLFQRLGERDAARVRVQARDGVVVVEPVQHAVPDAKRVAEALSGLAGMRRLDNRLQP